MKTYKVTAKKNEKFWFVQIPEINGFTQARRVPEIEVMARDYIEIVTEETEFELDIELKVSPKALKLLALSATHREQAQHLRSQAAEEYREATKLLKQEGLSVREIGKYLGISHQRVQQLVS